MPLISPRDCVVKVTLRDYQGGKFIVYESIDHKAKPVLPGVVRMFVYDRISIRPS